VAGQDGDRHHLLPLGGHHRQRRRGAAQRDQRVQVRVVAGQPDHRRDQPGQPLPVGIGGAVVDLPGERGQQRVRAAGMITPALPGQERRQLYEAGTPPGVSVLPAGQDRQQLGQVNVVTGHESPLRIDRARRV